MTTKVALDLTKLSSFCQQRMLEASYNNADWWIGINRKNLEEAQERIRKKLETDPVNAEAQFNYKTNMSFMDEQLEFISRAEENIAEWKSAQDAVTAVLSTHFPDSSVLQVSKKKKGYNPAEMEKRVQEALAK